MDRTLNISDALYTRLQATLQRRGFTNVEQLLESWLTQEEELRQRQETVQRIDSLREHLFAKYAKMPDSTDLLQDDRGR
jgi:hypothetical protein